MLSNDEAPYRVAPSDQSLELHDIAGTLDQITGEDALSQVLAWLDPPDSSLSYYSTRETRSPNTGQWLFQRLEFREWTESPNSVLWIHGIRECSFSLEKSERPRDCVSSLHYSLGALAITRRHYMRVDDSAAESGLPKAKTNYCKKVNGASGPAWS